jgi:hypothetical protein
VAAAALKAEESREAIAHLLQQGPYARFQRDVKQVQPSVIEQYASGTVAQVQEIQALRPEQGERSQLQNKEKALALLKSKLLIIAQEQRAKEIADIRGDMVEAAWGNQIRNYWNIRFKCCSL